MPPFYPPIAPSQRRREGRRVEAQSWPQPHPEWMAMANLGVVPQFTTYIPPPPFYPRHFEAIPGHPVGNVSPTFDAAAKDLRTVASSPIIRADEPKHRVDLDQPGRSGSGSVESALRELHHQLSAAHSTFDSYHNEWKADKAKIKYAEKETLENLWQDMLQAKTKDADEEVRFHGVGDKITRCMQQARDAANNVCFLDIPGDGYLVDRRKRIVTRVGLSCDAIVDLARKAAQDPAACDMLLKEIHEAIRVVDPNNEDLYGRAGSQASQASQAKATDDSSSRDNQQRNSNDADTWNN